MLIHLLHVVFHVLVDSAPHTGFMQDIFYCYSFCGEMDIFTDHQFLIIPNILGKSRAELFSKRLKEHGGRAWIFNAKRRPTDLSVYTHIITDPALTAEQLRKVLGEFTISLLCFMQQCIL